MADSQNVGIDWKNQLNAIKNNKYKVLIATREGATVIDATNVNLSFAGDMLVIVFETKTDNNVTLYRNTKNTWALNGKGEIKTLFMFYSSASNVLGTSSYSILNDDDTLNLSYNKLLDKSTKYGDAYYIYGESNLKKAYDNFDYETLPSWNVLNQGVSLLQDWFGLFNKELLNPNFHPVSDFKNFAIGLNPEIWSGNYYGSFYGHPFSRSYWSRLKGCSYSAFLNSIPSSVTDVLSAQLEKNNYISTHQFQAREARLISVYGQYYTYEDYLEDTVNVQLLGGVEVAKGLIPFSNCLVYSDTDNEPYPWYYTWTNSPDASEYLWGVANGTNMLVLNSEDPEKNVEESEKFIADPDNYNPPDEAQITTTDDNGVPETTTTEPTKPDPEDTSKDKDDNKDQTQFPTTWDSTTSATLYEITHEQLNNFINYFWGSGITQDADILPFLQGLYGNITEAVLGVTFLPINLDIPKSQKGVKVGRLETSFSWSAIADNVVSKTLGSISIKPQSGKKTFFDYAPYTELKLYLPYLGIVNLDTNSYMDTTLTVKLIVDVTSGNATYALLSDGTLYDTYTLQLGVSIPFTLSNGSQIQASMIQNAISCSLSAITTPINPVSGVKTIGNELTTLTDVTVPGYNNKGSVTGASTLGNCQNCILYIKRPIYNRPSNYGLVVGYPTNKTYKLSSIHGYTVCENAKIVSFKDKLTNTEYEEIINLLEKGVLLP